MLYQGSIHYPVGKLVEILANGIRIVGSESFITRMWTISGPGDLLVGMDNIILLTISLVVGWKLNLR
jgi:hypothetical protein